MAGWSGVLVVVVALLAATGAGVLVKRRSGNFRESVPAEAGPGHADATTDAALAGLGVTADTPVTLVQFSSAFCAPCRTTRVLCADVASRVPGVRHVEVDAESHLDAVRALEIWRTPTVLIVDDQGRIRRRASGAPTRTQLVSAIADLLPCAGLGSSLAHG